MSEPVGERDPRRGREGNDLDRHERVDGTSATAPYEPAPYPTRPDPAEPYPGDPYPADPYATHRFPPQLHPEMYPAAPYPGQGHPFPPQMSSAGPPLPHHQGMHYQPGIPHPMMPPPMMPPQAIQQTVVVNGGGRRVNHVLHLLLTLLTAGLWLPVWIILALANS